MKLNERKRGAIQVGEKMGSFCHFTQSPGTEEPFWCNGEFTAENATVEILVNPGIFDKEWSLCIFHRQKSRHPQIIKG